IWGDIPYSQAARPDSFPDPQLDAQLDVYDQLQALLSDAITNLSGEGPGPQDADLVYGGDPAAWIALAHTLKARLYLHTAEVNGTAAYASALAEAEQGIASNDGDYLAIFNGGLQGESNPWYQFMNANGGTGRDGDIIATSGTHLYSLLDDLDDPRRDEYYDLTNKAAGYLSDFRGGAAFMQPIVTYNENLLIMAEAQYQTGNAPGALESLEAEREAWGEATPWHSAITLPSVSASGPALLEAIMTEKYITLFQNLEAWNDYKRTCVPALVPVNGASVIPGRLPYGITERQTNPNVPEPSAQPARNANDPTPCPVP
ncbi:MAG TPA: SusD/RagB family nutrient-binding outer membrane lipoprotein, partial [Gemmatimonadaceae bacterium]